MEKCMEEILKRMDENLIQLIFSGAKNQDSPKKVKVHPFYKKNNLFFQIEEYRGNQVFHENVSKDKFEQKIVMSYINKFRQINVITKEDNMTVLISKKGKATYKIKKNETKLENDLTHNREKQYILKDDIKVPFLVDLGVQSEDGKIIVSQYKKFRQINRFLEFIRDILPEFDKEKKITIIDFGCGKSYLTFAMYYYLHELNQFEVNMIGLDLKKEVISHCNKMAEKYNYHNLKFYHGDIKDFEGIDKVDMVVTLHACDTATDYALSKAVKWNAKVILSVPCCQHELNKQIKNDRMLPVLKYGILKERMAALMTDGIRGNYLEKYGYKVDMLEFIDMSHTPKNIMIRGIKEQKEKEINLQPLLDEFHLDPTIHKLLK